MSFFVRIKFIAGHLQGYEYQYLRKNKMSCMSQTFGAPAFYLTDIVGIEIASEEAVKRLGGTIGGALVGGAILGGVGAIVGAIGSGSTTESTIFVHFKGGETALAVANSDMMRAIREHLFNLEHTPGYIEKFSATQSFFLRPAFVIPFLFLLFILFNSR